MSATMPAVVKAHAGPGIEMRDVPVPSPGAGEVLVRVDAASVCGTDLHIYNWDPWAQGRIHPPLVPGHEFCGTVAAVGRGVTTVKEGDAVDADGAFASYCVIPETNIWKLSPTIPREFASLLDPLGNAVHTVLAGPIAAQTVAITGCGAIGLFSIAVAKACCAA